MIKERGEYIYTINDNTGTITVIDYKGADQEAASHKGYVFKLVKRLIEY